MNARCNEPGRDCPLCPRLAGYRETLRLQHPDWHNAPVSDFGDGNACLAIVGLAPGVAGANRTGRPFTGDHAGAMLYAMLEKLGRSHGQYAAHADDRLTLDGVFITNAVRCVPPHNKPDVSEIHGCRPFLINTLKSLANLRAVLALGAIAHQSSVKALGGKLPKMPFSHGAVHRLHTGVTLIDSYHCSRLNTNTGRLTEAMFEAVLATALEIAYSPPLR